MRLIDADALIRELNEKLGCRTDINKIICGMTVYEPEIVRPQWIPVTEKLPETSKQYLVTVVELRWPKSTYDLIDSPTERPFVIAMYFDYTNKLWNASDGFVINALIDPEDILDGYVAVAWMPLPEPYTADAEENEGVQPAHWEKADIPLPYQMRTVPTPSGTFVHREMYVCSACDGYNDKNTQYCPHCGAKMDKEVNDDD